MTRSEELRDHADLGPIAGAPLDHLPILRRALSNWIRPTEHSDSARRFLIVLINSCIFALSAPIAFLLRFEFRIPPGEVNHLYFAAAVWVVLKIAVFHIAGLNRGWWRFVSVYDVWLLAAANGIGSIVSLAVISLFTPGFPRSVYIIYLLLCCLATCGVRICVRALVESGIRIQQADAGKRLLIYGAGMAGQAILREIRSNARLSFQVCGFLDDDIDKRGLSIQGVPVLATGEELARLAAAHRIEELLIAIPSASGSQMAAILKRCHQAKVRCKTVPGLGELVETNILSTQIRDVAVEDLLGRSTVSLGEARIRAALEGKTVLVTGAGGSIGSELCRQIARFRPAAIIGFDVAESPLFEIDRELRHSFPDTPFHAEIGTVQNRARLDEMLSQYQPDTVYHAAAYKHVPLMETHLFQAVENNIFGTYHLAAAAADHGVEAFVMISSDKAVRPTSIMGATKRAAELLLLALQRKGGRGCALSTGSPVAAPPVLRWIPEDDGRTKYVAVRFGNVLGSNGSVIPIFKKQIASGGPVTVTHPEMRRFFMTIPEACQLVLEAGAIGEGGQICVLEMGEPVKIVDLATNLILLSGLRPEADIKIEFTGMRPGEKLYEEISTLLEDTVPTAHEKIRIFLGNGASGCDMLAWLETLREICEGRDAGRLVVALKEAIPDYSPSAHLLKRVVAAGSHATAVIGYANAR